MTRLSVSSRWDWTTAVALHAKLSGQDNFMEIAPVLRHN